MPSWSAATRGGTVVGGSAYSRLFTHLVGSNTNNIACDRAIHNTSALHTICAPVHQDNLTVLRMQLDQEVTKGPVGDALDVRLPVSRSAGERRSRKLGQRVEVDVVGHCVQHVGNQGCETCGQQYRRGGYGHVDRH